MNSMQIFFNLKNKVYCYLTFYSLFAKMGKVNNILSDKDQEEIINYLLSISKDGVLPRGAQATACKKFAVKRSTLSDLWKKKADFRSKKKGKVGPKKIDRQVFRAAIRETTWEDRTTHLRNDRVLLENDDAYSTGMRATEIIDNFLHDNIQEDFDLLREQVVESEIEDGSDIELDDLLVRI